MGKKAERMERIAVYVFDDGYLTPEYDIAHQHETKTGLKPATRWYVPEWASVRQEAVSDMLVALECISRLIDSDEASKYIRQDIGCVAKEALAKAKGE